MIDPASQQRSGQTAQEESDEQVALAPHRPGAPGSNKEKSGLGIGIVVALVAALAIGWTIHARSREETHLHDRTIASAQRSVSVVHPQVLAKAEEINLPGAARAFQDTAINARTSGYLKNWKVDIGSRVKEGDVLAEIETPEVEQQLVQAQADLKNAQANLELARITSERAESLLKSHTVSQQERDQSAADLSAKRALVDAGAANVRRLQQLQSFQRIVAPFDGVVTARNTMVGALIQAGDTDTSHELFHLADTHLLRVYFSVPEIYASTIKAGTTVPITFNALPGESFNGQLVRDSAAIDPRSHTLMVEADVPNPEGRLLPGGYTTVHLRLPVIGGALTVPANTLLFRAEGSQIAAVREGHVKLIPVKIGSDHGQTLEVISELQPADDIILDPADSLAEGEPVTIEPSDVAKPK